MSRLWLGYKIGLRKKQSNTSAQTARDRAWQHDQQEEATKQRQKKDEQIGRFKSFLDRQINSVHEFSGMHNDVCVHVTYTVVTVHANCKVLIIAT